MDSIGAEPDQVSGSAAETVRLGGGEVVNINAVELPGWLLSAARAAARLLKASGAGVYVIRVIVTDRGDPAWTLAREDLLRRG